MEKGTIYLNEARLLSNPDIINKAVQHFKINLRGLDVYLLKVSSVNCVYKTDKRLTCANFA